MFNNKKFIPTTPGTVGNISQTSPLPVGAPVRAHQNHISSARPKCLLVYLHTLYSGQPLTL